MTSTEALAGHTRRDYDALVAAGVDPTTTQPRERAVRCWCGRETWHQVGYCDEHYLPPGRSATESQRVSAACRAVGALFVILSDTSIAIDRTLGLDHLERARVEVDRLADALGLSHVDWTTGILEARS
jgi:hypothetical protein